jgi:hypothetical protein
MSLILILLSAQFLQAQTIHPVGIMLKDETHFSAQLLEADAQTYLIYNTEEACQQFVERADVLYMESNLDVDLRELAASTDANQCRDRVFLTDGSTITCVILEMTTDWIAYSINGELNRRVARSESIEMVRLGQDGMLIPWSGTRDLSAL